MNNEVVLYHAENGVATVTLNRPNQRNAINPEVCDAIRAAFDQVEADPDVRVAVLTGAGTLFCAGMDLKAFAGGAGITDEIDSPDAPELRWRETMLEIRGPILEDWQQLFTESWNRFAMKKLTLPGITAEFFENGQAGRVTVNEARPQAPRTGGGGRGGGGFGGGGGGFGDKRRSRF